MILRKTDYSILTTEMDRTVKQQGLLRSTGVNSGTWAVERLPSADSGKPRMAAVRIEQTRGKRAVCAPTAVSTT